MNIPKNIAGKDFNDNKYAYFEELRENSPVHKGKFFVMNATFLSRYQDCADILRDDRFIRNRSVALGGGARMPFPLPKSVALVATSMITEDHPAHRRLRPAAARTRRSVSGAESYPGWHSSSTMVISEPSRCWI